ncbi:MAG: MBL fold metallo-hydrolase [Smithellaceae bacterium]
MARFCPLFSSSGGNCYYIGGDNGSILIDAGVSAKRIEIAMNQMAINPSSIDAIFVTHEHTDHVNGLRVLASRLGCEVYSSEGTLQKLHAMGHLSARFKTDVIDSKGIEAAGMFIKPFATLHDSCDSIGYIINTDDQRMVAIATDLGCITDEVRVAMRGSDLVVLESNHDVSMLENGRYPHYLKRRILSERGHLSNDCCAAELPLMVKTGATSIFLAHLSRENNVPQLAYQTALKALLVAGMQENIDFTLNVAPVSQPQEVTIF